MSLRNKSHEFLFVFYYLSMFKFKPIRSRLVTLPALSMHLSKQLTHLLLISLNLSKTVLKRKLETTNVPQWSSFYKLNISVNLHVSNHLLLAL